MAYPKNKPSIETRFEDLVNSADLADLMVLSMGFYAGWEGATVIDAFIKSTGADAIGSMLNPLKLRVSNAKQDPVVAAAMGVGSYIGFAATLNPFVTVLAGNWFGSMAKGMESPQTPNGTSVNPNSYIDYGKMTNAQQATLNDATKAKIAMGCIGAILAYAVTRPGFLPALMGLAGNIVGDLTGGIGAAGGAVGI